MVGSRVFKAALLAGLAISADALAVKRQDMNELIRPYKREPLQDIVCSFTIDNERELGS